MVMERDLTLGGKHTMYTLFTNVTSINKNNVSNNIVVEMQTNWINSRIHRTEEQISKLQRSNRKKISESL